MERVANLSLKMNLYYKKIGMYMLSTAVKSENKCIHSSYAGINDVTYYKHINMYISTFTSLN